MVGFDSDDVPFIDPADNDGMLIACLESNVIAGTDALDAPGSIAAQDGSYGIIAFIA